MNQRRKLMMVGLSILGLTSLSGCNFLPQLAYMSGASLVAADYSELEGQRVAVICVSDTASYGSGSEGEQLSRLVGSIIAENVEEVDVVSPSEIADWVDRNGWDEIDYREVGQGVKADRVVAIDLEGFRLHQGQTLYKGRAAVSLTVFDMTKNGKEVFHREIPEISYPANGVYPTTETSEETFRRIFLQVMAKRCSRYFFEYDPLDEFGPDPAALP